MGKSQNVRIKNAFSPLLITRYNIDLILQFITFHFWSAKQTNEIKKRQQRQYSRCFGDRSRDVLSSC